MPNSSQFSVTTPSNVACVMRFAIVAWIGKCGSQPEVQKPTTNPELEINLVKNYQTSIFRTPCQKRMKEEQWNSQQAI
jgi:hypothetical protein